MQLINSELYKTLVIKETNEEIKGFKTITFEATPEIPYQAGQYITLVDIVNDEEVRRSYSITSSPALQEPLTIGVKRIENGQLSRKLVDLAQPGDTWLTTGAGGFFTLPANAAEIKQLLFFAAGSGITPMYALIKTVLHQHPHIQMVLVYSSPSPERTLFRDALEQLQQQYPAQLKIEFLYSNLPDLQRAHLHRDLFLQLLQQYVTAGTTEVLYYICGPEAYMRMCTYILQEQGIPPEQIRKENFIIDKAPPPKAEPPDKSPHAVTIIAGENAILFTAAYPQTILAAAEAAGHSLPYSCRVGRCGNCAARCVKGKVYIGYNEVLSDREVGNGFILTCTSYPIEGDVTIQL
jgi:ferredoxin-NADP reductase